MGENGFCSHQRWIDVLQRPYLTHKSFNNSFLDVPISHTTRYVRNVFPINVPSLPLSIHYLPPIQHPFQTYHRVIFITPKTIHTTKAIYIYKLCLEDFTIYKNFLTVWLQTFFRQTQITYNNFFYIWYILYKIAKNTTYRILPQYYPLFMIIQLLTFYKV